MVGTGYIVLKIKKELPSLETNKDITEHLVIEMLYLRLNDTCAKVIW